MKNMLILLCLLCCSVSSSLAQDLISQTQRGAGISSHTKQPNAVSQLIEDRKKQQADFRAVKLFDPVHFQDEYSNVVSDAVFLQLNRERLQRFLDNPGKDILMSVPVGGGRQIELELTQVNIVAPDFKVVTASGRTEFIAPTGYFYHGIVKGDLGSLAALSVFGDEVRLLVADEAGNYVLGALGPADEKKSSNYIFYNDRKLKVKHPFECHIPENAFSKGMNRLPLEKASPADVGDCVGIYFECDFAMYNAFGSNAGRVTNYVLGLFNEVEIMYRAEQISVELSQIFIWTMPDPYASAIGTDVALELFGQNRQNNYSGRLAHLLSTRNLGGGLAWIDVLCSDYFTFMADFDGDGADELHHAGPYGVSAIATTFANVPVYSWSVEVVTHELGHNFGSPHTHACAWNGDNTQIDDCGNSAAGGDGVFDSDDDGEADDGCYNPFAAPAQVRIIPAGGGTVMSYCHQNAVGISLALGFGQQPGDLIRGRVAGAACLSSQCSCDAFTDRTINGSPIPSSVYTAGNSITSSGDANAPANNVVVFRAGDRIALLPGFEATDMFLAEVSSSICDQSAGAMLALLPDLKVTERNTSKMEGLNLELSPNPASVEIQLVCRFPSQGAMSIRVFNQYGQSISTIEENSLQPEGEYKMTIPLHHWPSGLYYLVLRSSGEQVVKPFIVTRY